MDNYIKVDQQLKCISCGKVFSKNENENNLNQHLNTHKMKDENRSRKIDDFFRKKAKTHEDLSIQIQVGLPIQEDLSIFPQQIQNQPTNYQEILIIESNNEEMQIDNKYPCTVYKPQVPEPFIDNWVFEILN